ncbi:protein-glutamine glutaminase family protein [Cytophaga aurantiaca]|uniref:protein-glutamine glutaminase family protein n=1 Tax=Cytophaga aurantiaca TaxID=29530 RepID=UPI000372F9EB|nr:protein-glutamine glutaminase family protein [Cytophaga aurantiaca]
MLTEGKSTVVDMQTAQILFDQIQNAGIPFTYPQANCHNIAHYISLLAKRQGITLAKIWAFTPGIYTSYNTRVITFKDKNQLSPTGKIDWGYHVAPVLFVEQDGVVTKMVIDGVLFPNGAVPYKAWLAKIKTKKLIYLLMDAEWYLFNTSYVTNTQLDFFDGNTDEPVKPNVIFPYWFANKCVTDFFKYEDNSKENGWLEKGLAINNTAGIFYENEIKPILNDASQEVLLNDYRSLVGNVLNFENVFRDYVYNSEMDEQFHETHAAIISTYRTIFNNECLKWQQRVSEVLPFE